MKKLFSILLVTLLIVWGSFGRPELTIAANGAEDFNGTGYIDGTDLNTLGVGLNGGTGWGEAWQLVGGHNSLVVEATGCSAANCAVSDGDNADHGNDRNLEAGIDDGLFTYYGKNNDGANSANLHVWFQAADGTGRFRTSFQRAGLGHAMTIVGDSSVSIGTWADATWMKVEVAWGSLGSDTYGDGACAANEAQASVDDGAWSTCTSFTNDGNIENIYLEYGGGGGTILGYYDDFTITDADAGAGGGAASYYPAPLWSRRTL